MATPRLFQRMRHQATRQRTLGLLVLCCIPRRRTRVVTVIQTLRKPSVGVHRRGTACYIRFQHFLPLLMPLRSIEPSPPRPSFYNPISYLTGQSLDVRAGVDLNNLISIDEVQGAVTLDLYFRLYWAVSNDGAISLFYHLFSCFLLRPFPSSFPSSFPAILFQQSLAHQSIQILYRSLD